MPTKRTARSLRNNLRQHRKAITFYGGIFLVIFVSVFGASLYFSYLAKELPSIQALRTFEPYLTTEVISADGVVIKELSIESRVLVAFDRMPKVLIHALIATEDQRFYSHWGVDSYRFFGAAFEVLKSFSYSEGFSTITMQLARDLYLNRRREITRKLREIMTAIQIEKQYSKNEILEMFLNKMNFGHGKYGIHEAAAFFFEKDVEDLELEEIALLVAMLNGPRYYSPLFKDNGLRPMNRRNLVLRNMYNQGFITATQYNEARSKPIVVKGKLRTTEESLAYGIAPYFTEHIRQKLEKMQGQYGFNLYRDGLKVYTTLDTRAQAIAEKAVAEQIKRQQDIINNRYRFKWARIELLENLPGKNIDLKKVPELASNDAFMDSLLSTDYQIQAAFASMDLKTGHVLAMIGGRDFKESKYNRALQAERQPGSVFKPFIYAVAIDNGYQLTYELLNQPVTLLMPDGSRWTPSNYDGTTSGYTTLREGLTRSLNLISVRLIQQIVPPRAVVKQAKAMGITSAIAPVDAIALGSSSLILMEVISAYSAFPNKGIKVNPVYITKIEDRFGSVLYENSLPQKDVVLSEETAYIMTDLLREVVLRGTGRDSWRVYGFRRPAGGKTGTTDDHTDAWFIGFTPQIISGVWVGVDDPAYTLGPGQSGAIVALPVWSKYMKAIHDTLALPEMDFEVPVGIIRLEICNETKDIASRYCPVKFTEIFKQDAKPLQECRIHRRF